MTWTACIVTSDWRCDATREGRHYDFCSRPAAALPLQPPHLPTCLLPSVSSPLHAENGCKQTVHGKRKRSEGRSGGAHDGGTAATTATGSCAAEDGAVGRLAVRWSVLLAVCWSHFVCLYLQRPLASEAGHRASAPPAGSGMHNSQEAYAAGAGPTTWASTACWGWRLLGGRATPISARWAGAGGMRICQPDGPTSGASLFCVPCFTTRTAHARVVNSAQ